MHKYFLTILSVLAGLAMNAQTYAPDGSFGLAPQIQNIGGMEKVSMNGNWKAFIDQYETGYYDFNRKGLLSEHGERKQAFYTYQSWNK